MAIRAHPSRRILQEFRASVLVLARGARILFRARGRKRREAGALEELQEQRRGRGRVLRPARGLSVLVSRELRRRRSFLRRELWQPEEVVARRRVRILVT